MKNINRTAIIIAIILIFIPLSTFSQTTKPKSTSATAPKQTPMPDLIIDTKSIIFSNPTPTEGDAVTIYANVVNKGTADIKDDVEVRFVEGDPKEFGLQIGSDAAIFGLKAGASAKVQVRWRPPAGESRIFIIADPDNLIKESNENNNQHIKNIKAKTWTGPKVTDEQIKESIKKGLDWLRTQQGEFYVTCPNGHDNFLYSAIGYGKCVICGASLKGIEPTRAVDERMPGGWMPEIGPGLTSLCVAALLYAGVDESDPAVQKGLDHLFTKTPSPWKEWTDPYDYSVFVIALTATGNKKEYMDEVEFCVEKLIKLQSPDGGWGYGNMATDAA
ncbi:MAG: CARDB domain-containing protein, partial [Candidatus Poribacteria bacterium]